MQPVIFDAKPHTIDDVTRDAIIWKQLDSHTFERQLLQGTRLLNVRRLTVSADGATLAEVRTTPRGNGQADIVDTWTYTRTSGDTQGLTGVWKPASFSTTSPLVVRYERAEPNGLTLTTSFGARQPIVFDGKPRRVEGPGTIPDTMIAGRIVDDHTIETTDSRGGAVTGKTRSSVSQDGLTLTATTTIVGTEGEKQPFTTIFEKQ
jgi:hypothetical protein